VKAAVICYHKNADKLYPPEWIYEFQHTILNQTNKSFDIFEMNYGGDDYRIFDYSFFYSKKQETFVDALQELLDICFVAGYDYVFNTNCDDFYSLARIERQLHYLKQGYDIVSANFHNVYESGEMKPLMFHEKDIKKELELGHNVICHPVVAYSRNFWERNRYIANQIPLEDLMLWQRAYTNCKFIIMEDILCFHRIHESSVCRSTNR